MSVTNESVAQALKLAIDRGASDVLLTDGLAPYIRLDGNLLPVQHTDLLNSEDIDQVIKSITTEQNFKAFKENLEVDFSFSHEGTRVRANAFHQKDKPALSLRIIPSHIRDYTELGLPPIVKRFGSSKRGFAIIAGPTGHGKSSTLAAIIDDINSNQLGHIITIEDPIEYVFKHKKSVISQREVGTDTKSFHAALRSAVREDPNVVLIGEIRDQETAEIALMLAETGHLVLSTLHTNSAAQSADRLINMFPTNLQATARQQLSNVLLGIISQRLIPKVGGGRTVAAEIMVATPAIRSLIRENKTHQIDNVISTSVSDGMISLDKVIAELISKGEITLDDGLQWANDQKSVKSMLY